MDQNQILAQLLMQQGMQGTQGGPSQPSPANTMGRQMQLLGGAGLGLAGLNTMAVPPVGAPLAVGGAGLAANAVTDRDQDVWLNQARSELMRYLNSWNR